MNLGTRYSQYNNNYSVTGTNYENDELVPIASLHKSLKDNVFSYHFSIKNKITNSLQILNSINKGYKWGGINQNPYLNESQRFYRPEINFSFNTSLSSLLKKHEITIDLFYMKRKNQQVGLYFQMDENDPTSFSYYTANAKKE